MPDATDWKLRQVLDFQRATLWVGLAVCALACGEKFTGVESGNAGAGGETNDGGADTVSGSSAGGKSANGGSSSGGKAAGGASAGRGGMNGLGGAVVGGSAGASIVAGGGGVGGSVVEQPAVPLEGLELWFDATVGITETNGGISMWKDRSGKARHALQTALNYRPQLAPEALSGLPGVAFDGVDDYMKVPTLPGDFTAGVSIFAMTQQVADDGTCTGFFEASNGPEIDDVHLGTWQSALLYEVAADIVHPTEQPLVLGNSQLLAAVQQATGAVQLRRDSSALGEANVPLPVTIPREQVYLGDTAYEGCASMTGNLYEILVYSRAVSDLELIAIESYLQEKWGCCGE